MAYKKTEQYEDNVTKGLIKNYELPDFLKKQIEYIKNQKSNRNLPILKINYNIAIQTTRTGELIGEPKSNEVLKHKLVKDFEKRFES